MADERQGPESTPAGQRAEQTRNEPGASAEGPIEGPAEGVLTLLCFTCGKYYFFADAPPPEEMSCAKCGGTVFRSVFSPQEGDEAAQDFEDSTARDLDPDDPEGDVMPGDILDLNRE